MSFDILKPGDLHPLLIKTSTGDEYRFDIEIARTEAQKLLGLMFRTELAINSGMLFVYAIEGQEDKAQSIWMKNTFIALDIIFIDKNKQIVKIVDSAKPMSLEHRNSDLPISYVLELNAGVCKSKGVQAGDSVSFDLTS